MEYVHLPRVVQVVFTRFDQQYLEIPIQIGKTTGNDAAGASATADDNVDFIWDGHGGLLHLIGLGVKRDAILRMRIRTQSQLRGFIYLKSTQHLLTR